LSRFCTPDCPYFRCLKKALVFVTPTGRMLRPRDRRPRNATPWCMWANDVCRGYKCQYANCVKHYMLPDGRCASGIGEGKRERRSIEEEAKQLEGEYMKLRPKLKRLRIDDLDL